MREEGLTALLKIPQGVDIIKKCGLSISTEIKKMLNMVRRHEISVDILNEIPIKEVGMNKRE